MRSPLAVRSFAFAAATIAATLAVTPSAAEAQSVASARQATPRPAARAVAPVAPRLGQCAHHPRTDQLLGRVVSVGPVNLDAANRRAPGQRRVEVELKNGIDIGVTYPRNLKLRDCR